MKKILKNRHAVLLLLVITGFMFVLIGGSYAYFGAVASSEEQVVTSGSLELVYHTGQDIVIDHALPTDEENASVHTFTVENIGMKSVEYNISFVDIMLTKDGENTFSPNLKWALYSSDEDYNNQVLIKNGSFSSISGYLSGDNEFVIKTKLPLDVGMKNSYVLKVWLQETGKVQNKDINMDLSLKVQVDDLQREEAVGKKSVLPETFEGYADKYSKIVFQNKIEDVSGVDTYYKLGDNVIVYFMDDVMYVQGNDELYLSNGYQFFYGVDDIENIEYLNTSEATNMSEMFRQCGALNLDLSNFDTSQVTDMSGMFTDCSNLTSLDLSSFDTSKVTNMNEMFSGCSNLINLDLSHFNTSQVAEMESMFKNCTNLVSLDLSNFNTLSVFNMSSMFYNCKSLTYLDLSSFCYSLSDPKSRGIILWLTLDSMFNECSNLKVIDFRNADFPNQFITGGMFSGIYPNVQIIVKNSEIQKKFIEILDSFGIDGKVIVAK